SEEHTSELQSLTNLVCRLLLEKKNAPAATVVAPATNRKSIFGQSFRNYRRTSDRDGASDQHIGPTMGNSLYTWPPADSHSPRNTGATRVRHAGTKPR